MIVKKELLSENLKAYMDHSMEVMNSLDGAPDHSTSQVKSVNDQIDDLKIYLEHLKASYNETASNGNTSNRDAGISDIVL